MALRFLFTAGAFAALAATAGEIALPTSNPDDQIRFCWYMAKEYLDRVHDAGFNTIIDAPGTSWYRDDRTTQDHKFKSRRPFLDKVGELGLDYIEQVKFSQCWPLVKDYARTRADGTKSRYGLDLSVKACQAELPGLAARAAEVLKDYSCVVGVQTDTEVRDQSHPTFTKEYAERCERELGFPMPKDMVGHTAGHYSRFGDFPVSRVVDPDYRPLKYYMWFWKTGDGWNDHHRMVAKTFESVLGRKLLTVYDPAIRTPPIWGSGAGLTHIAQWFYEEPEPYGVSYTISEQQAMARGCPGQKVNTMLQGIADRERIAPKNRKVENEPFWVSDRPNATYITQPPDIVREALWTAFSRQIDGIGLYAWSAYFDHTVLPGESGKDAACYQFTNPDMFPVVEDAFRRAGVPLGPLFKAVPERKPEVAILESYASTILGSVGTWGWGSRWGDFALAANLAPYVLYEEEIARDGIPPTLKVLLMPDCPVLTKRTFEAVERFQQNGGIIAADEKLVPGLLPDLMLPDDLLSDYARKFDGVGDRRQIRKNVRTFRQDLLNAFGYRPYADSQNPDILASARTYRDADYVFAVNDKRTFGDYVGPWKTVEEKGLPNDGTVSVRREAGAVYDLVEHREAPFSVRAGVTKIPVSYTTTDGRIFLVTSRKLGALTIRASRGKVSVFSSDKDVMIPIEVTADGMKPRYGVVADGAWVRDCASTVNLKVRNLADGKTYALVPAVVPTPTKASFDGADSVIDGFRPEPCADFPEYALEMGDRIFHGGAKLAFARDATLGEQAYRIRSSEDGVAVTAGDDVGFIYAVSTLLQMTRPLADGRWAVACGTVDDRPAYSIRGVNWNLFVEARGWSQDDGDGQDAFRRRFVAGLDTLAYLKLNAAIVDGTGWNPERFPGFGKLMRELSAEARRRGIRIGCVGYSEGYGAQWYAEDGPKFENRRSYPDGEVYDCFGLSDGSPQVRMGTCLANDALMELKKKNFAEFVRATEPGFVYVHGADISWMCEMTEAWSNRCAACRKRWPNESTTASDGAPKAFAHLYDSLYEAMASVKDPETGYDAARDCVFYATAPNYGAYWETDEEWDYHVDYFSQLGKCLKHKDIRMVLREQYVGDDGKLRFEKLRAKAGKEAKYMVIVFCAGDGFYNFNPVTAEPAMSGYYKGADEVVAGGGNAYMEPRQAVWAEYLWNPEGSAWAWDSKPADLWDSIDDYDDFSRGLIRPEPVVRPNTGLLSEVCRKLYGEDAGAKVAGLMSVDFITDCDAGRYGDVAVLMPLATERLPGTRFCRFRRRGCDLRWRADLSERVLDILKVEIAVEKASVAKTRRAITGFREAADLCDSDVPAQPGMRAEVLRRMSRCCETSAALGDLTVLWLELLGEGHAALAGDGDRAAFAARVDELARGAAEWIAKFEKKLKTMLDISGGNAKDGLRTAEYLRVEAANMKETLASGKYPEHEYQKWW